MLISLVCYPGGKCEGAELPVETALREAKEEIGLHPDQVTILGELEPIISRSYHETHIFVGYVSGTYKPVLSSGEVDRVSYIIL
jgi:8-oxo-dGTP pyrophosphatase MutT (NUDIX family)